MCSSCRHAAYSLKDPKDYVRILNYNYHEASSFEEEERIEIVENLLNHDISDEFYIFHAQTGNVDGIDHWIIKLCPITDENTFYHRNHIAVFSDIGNITQHSNTNERSSYNTECRLQ